MSCGASRSHPPALCSAAASISSTRGVAVASCAAGTRCRRPLRPQVAATDAAPAAAVVAKPPARMAATTRAAKAALCGLDRPLSHDCALQDVARALASLSSAVAMRDEAAVHGTRSDLDTARGALYEIRVSLATADHKASVQVLRLTEMVVDPEAFTEENVEHVASLAREQLVVVSKLEVEEGELCSKVQTLQAVKPPRHQIFTSAAAAADAVMVYVPLSGKSSSDQTATSFGKVGPSTFPCMGFDSTSDGRVWRALVPSRKLSVAEAGAPPLRLMGGVMMDARMRGAPELNKPGLDGVESSFGPFLDRLYRADGEAVRNQQTISSLRLPPVHATSGSTPDNVGGFDLHKDDFVPLRVREYKGSASSCLDALPQGLESGACIAVGLLLRGLPAEHVIVPVDVTTGKNAQFAAVFIAGGRFPIAVVTSEELDLSHHDGAVLADRYYRKTRDHLHQVMQLVKEAVPVAVPDADIDVLSVPKSLYCKQACLSFQALESWEQSVWHVGRVLAHLHHVGPRDSICFPLGYCYVAREGLSRCRTTDMIFPNLTEEDPPYNLFVPTDLATAKMFVAACGRVASRLHRAGVVHGDLYVSNFAWRLCRGVMEVKVLDWDTAFFIGQAIPKNLHDAWKSTNKWKGRFDVTKQVEELDLFMIRAMEWGVHDDDPSAEGWKLWLRAANAPNQRVVNSVFRTLQERYLSVCNSTERQPLERGVSS